MYVKVGQSQKANTESMSGLRRNTGQEVSLPIPRRASDGEGKQETAKLCEALKKSHQR